MNALTNLLLTGGAASDFIPWLLREARDFRGVVTHLGPAPCPGCDNPRYFFAKGNSTDHDCLTAVFEQRRIDTVIAFSSNASSGNTEEDIKTNVLGTCALLEAARRYWLDHNMRGNALFCYVSALERAAPLTPYHATLLSGEEMARSFSHRYALPVMVVRRPACHQRLWDALKGNCG